MKKYPYKSRGQAYQEIFAWSVGRSGGTYIEIGAYKPVSKNNTFNLEVHEGWRGFSIEFNEKLREHWDNCQERQNPIFFADALTFDYAGKVQELGLPQRITFLSCDIEPPRNTFTALQRAIEQGIDFDCITFEHDNYAKKKRGDEDYDVLAREYLATRGYRVAVSDVYCKQPEYQFETWFVKDDIDFEQCTFDQWKARMGL
jgi:hypothetical protein